jgi:hypothetical protein
MKKLIFLISLSYGSTLFAQGWQPIGPTIPGAMSSMCTIDSVSLAITVTLEKDPAHDMYRSTDSGTSWTKVDFPNTFSFERPKYVTAIHGMFYTMTTARDAEKRLLYSRDGLSWTERTYPGSGWEVPFLKDLGDTVLAIKDGSTAYSTDSGWMWKSFTEDRGDTLHGLCVDAVLLDTLLIVLHHVPLSAGKQELTRSVDRLGQTWKRLTFPTNEWPWPIGRIWTFKGDIYAGGVKQLYVSTDLGMSWDSLMPAGGVASHYPLTTYQDKLWVATDSGVYYSSNPRAGWEGKIPLPDNIIAYQIGFGVIGNSLFYSTAGSGIYRLTSSNTWENITKGFDPSFISSTWGDRRMLFCQPFDGTAMYSTNFGDTWSNIRRFVPTEPIHMWAMASSNEVPYILLGDRVSLSSDGISWSQLTEKTPWNNVSGFTAGNGVWVVVSDKSEGIFRSTDQGKIWAKNTDLVAKGRFLDLTYYNSTFYTISHNEGLVRSNSDASAWEKITDNNLPTGAPQGISTIGAIGSTMLVGGKNAIYRSTDHGLSFVKDTIKISNTVADIDVYNENMCFVTPYGKVYLSTNSGEQFADITNGLNTNLVRSIHFCGSYIITQTYDNGLFRYQYKPLTVSSPYRQIGSLKIYPNPSTETLHIDLSSGLLLQLDWSIYNATGTLCKHASITSPCDALSIPIEELAAGVYYIEVTTPAKRSIGSFIKK